jgi:hypothetical protein
MSYSAIIATLATDLSNAENEIAELKEDLEFEKNESRQLRNELFLMREQLLKLKCAATSKTQPAPPIEESPAARATAFMMREGKTLWKDKKIRLVKEVMAMTGWRIKPAMDWLSAYMEVQAEVDEIPVLLEDPIPATQRSQERLLA